MAKVLDAIAHWTRVRPQAPAVTGLTVSLTYQELYAAVGELQAYLEQRRPKVLGVLLDNSPAWVMIDLAAQAANIALLPIPGFFSAQQIQHAMEETGCDCVLTDQPERFNTYASHTPQANQNLSAVFNGKDTVWEILLNPSAHTKLKKNIAKITYTSGTTGAPKGVCLQQSVIDTVAGSLCQTVEMVTTDRHLCALPLATLLENIAGVYVPLLSGAQGFVYPLEQIGLRGAVEFDAYHFQHALTETQATTTVLVPHLLQQLIERCETTPAVLPDLRFIAVGGAPLATDLLERAQRCGLPVYEGYGLSECASVVAVNMPQAQRPGSVGKPLPHVALEFAADGEILVKGARFCGYLGQKEDTADFLSTGDIGYLDDDGYLYLTGRKKNMFITAFGRNVSPEWVERELVLAPAINQAAVFGEGRPWNMAVIVPLSSSSDVDVSYAIKKANAQLPDYARINTWIAATEPFGLANQQLTVTGRLRRNVIWQQYAKRIEALYSSNHEPYRKSA